MNNPISKLQNFTSNQVELEQANLHETYRLTNYMPSSHVMVCMPTKSSQITLACEE